MNNHTIWDKDSTNINININIKSLQILQAFTRYSPPFLTNYVICPM